MIIVSGLMLMTTVVRFHKLLDQFVLVVSILFGAESGFQCVIIDHSGIVIAKPLPR